MGGGDLNTKKSWHPNNMKNQERVWKAEQAVAEEKKRIQELQRERDEERDRSNFNDMAKRNYGSGVSDDGRLHWMYDKPDKQTQQEDYLLGKAVGKSEEQENGEQYAIPAVNRRVVGSSMLTAADDSQVDLARKLREDPLLLVKERERAARAALLNNPLQRKKIAELLRKEQEQKENKLKKKSKKPGKDLDSMLAAKLTALGGDKGIDLATLLNSDDSSSDSSSDDGKSKKKKKEKKSKKSKKKKKKSRTSSSDDSSNDERDKRKKENNKKENKNNTEYRHNKNENEKRKTHYQESDERSYRNKHYESRKRRSPDDRKWESKRRKSADSDRDQEQRIERRTDTPGRYWSRPAAAERDTQQRIERGHSEKKGRSEAEIAAKLAEMAEAGREREQERGRRVAAQRAADDETPSVAPRRHRPEHATLPHSLEDRIRSNRHYIQRDRKHMNEHFARR